MMLMSRNWRRLTLLPVLSWQGPETPDLEAVVEGGVEDRAEMHVNHLVS